MTPEEAMFQEAMSAVHSGDRARARDLFTRLLKLNPSNADYWLWMSSVVDTVKERAYCLNEVLRRDPENHAAKRGLQLLGLAQPDESQVIPLRLMKRSWQAAALPGGEERTPLPLGGWRQWVIIIGAILILIALVGIAIYGSRRVTQGRIILPTDFPNPPTFTPLPSTTPVHRSATPTFTGPTPLWMQMQITYTPTPLYVNTPHPVSEAYSIGIRAYKRGDWADLETYMLQLVTVQPSAVDALYYAGEAKRFQGQFDQAVNYYTRAIQTDPSFGPAYLGRARGILGDSPNADSAARARADLETAVENDPNLGEAYLELANLDLADGEYEAAFERLDQVEALLPGSPLLHITRGRAYLGQGDTPKALEEAQTASEMDFTSLPAYRFLAEALQAEGEIEQSLVPLETYLRYVSDDPGAYILAARAYEDAQEPEAALEALTAALKLDNNSFDAIMQRARLYMNQKDYSSAVDDFRRAVELDKESFTANLAVGEALLKLDFPGDAYVQFERTIGLVETDAQMGELYYWEAQSLELLDKSEVAYAMWNKLLELPSDALESAWTALARQRIAALATPTRTSTASASATRTVTPSATRTATPSPTRPRATPTPSPTP
jgi:tetratricopeptide (TPR) repeat protein